jgi:tRNA(Ile2) C34 agmatinyltransferase TiaS
MSVVMSEATTAEDIAEFANALSKPQCSECGGAMHLVSAGPYCGGGWECRDCGRQKRA